MEDFLMTFEGTFQKVFQNQPADFLEADFVTVGSKLEAFLFMDHSKLKELFALFASDNQVLFSRVSLRWKRLDLNRTT